MLRAVGLNKAYRRHTHRIQVLTDLTLAVEAGEFLSIVGQSGSGKSTLLHLLGSLDRPDSGSILLNGRRIDDVGRRERDALRNRTFGFIFQFYHLLPELTMLENVMMPAMIRSGIFAWPGRRTEARNRATAILERVGLGHRLRHRPRELSGGEMQRTAIARALVAGPKILFADEPTGNLDAESGDDILRLLRSFNRDEKVTILMVTHNPEMAKTTDRVVRMAGGRLVDASPVEKPMGSESGIPRGVVIAAA